MFKQYHQHYNIGDSYNQAIVCMLASYWIVKMIMLSSLAGIIDPTWQPFTSLDYKNQDFYRRMAQ